MGRKSKANKARLNNLQLGQNRIKSVIPSTENTNVSTEIVPNIIELSGDNASDIESNLDFRLDDYVKGLDFDGEEEGEVEIECEVGLTTFIKTLQNAQIVAQEEERLRRARTKRPRFYTGNSKRTKERYTAKRHKNVQEGEQGFITDQ